MLYRELEVYKKEYENFAYLCKFDRETKTLGEEKLFLSNSKPITADAGLEKFLDQMERLSMETGSSELPLYIGYDAVEELYPLHSIKRSTWPVAASIVPDRQLKGTIVRHGFPQARERVTQAFFDQDLLQKIEEARCRIIAGELLQVVLSRKFNVPDIEPISLLQHFVENDRSLYVFYFKIGEFEIIGSSPENIVSREGESLEVHPIAGTTQRGANDSEDRELADKMLSDPKELREHRMLVDLARNDLGVVSVPGSVHVVKSMEIQKFASVQHIVSTVRSMLVDGKRNYDVIKSLFPAGTVSGAPKIRAMQLIDHYENSPRGPYAGGLGTITQDRMDLALLIRSVFIQNGKAYTQAGAGIVMDSNPEKEVREFRSKAETVIGGIRSESVDH